MSCELKKDRKKGEKTLTRALVMKNLGGWRGRDVITFALSSRCTSSIIGCVGSQRGNLFLLSGGCRPNFAKGSVSFFGHGSQNISNFHTVRQLDVGLATRLGGKTFSLL